MLCILSIVLGHRVAQPLGHLGNGLRPQKKRHLIMANKMPWPFLLANKCLVYWSYNVKFLKKAQRYNEYKLFFKILYYFLMLCSLLPE